MRKIIFALSVLSLIFTASAFAGATDNISNAEGSINIVDGTGGGPGVSGIAVSAAAYVVYSAASGSGGYTASTTGQTMACVAYNTKADAEVQLMFGVRSSMVPGDNDDNRVYQLGAQGTAFTSSSATTNHDFTGTGWLVRGGS